MTVDLTTVAGLAAATSIIVQIVLTSLALSADASSRFGPLLALGVGIGLSVVHAATAGTVDATGFLSAVMLGLAAGSSAMGVHNVVTKSAVGSTVASALGVTRAPAT